MNKKNKNKNRSKPANPVPPPKKPEPVPVIEDIAPVIVEEKSKNVKKESEVVIETISDVSVPPAEEIDSTPETPKKPKRKGKKKKNEDSDAEETKTSSNDAPIELPPPVADTEVKDDKVEITDTKTEEDKKTEDITPNVRKKKNKKKQNEPAKVQESAQDIVVSETLKDNDKEKIEDVITKKLPDPVASPEIIEPENKQAKKKNKKKKRHDSERSDKADETIACTAAFQKLISSTEKEDEPTSVIPPSSETIEKNKEPNITSKEETLKALIESVLLPEELQESETDLKEDAQKGKKKNKRDKKPRTPTREPEKNVSSDTQIIQQELTKADITVPENKQEIIEGDIKQEKIPIIDPVVSESSEDTKPKAKIAKPVEKKRKEKRKSSQSNDEKLDDNNTVGITEPVTEQIPKKEELKKDLPLPTDSLHTSASAVEEIPTIQPQLEKMSTEITFENPPESLITPESLTSKFEVPRSEDATELLKEKLDKKIEESIEIEKAEKAETESESLNIQTDIPSTPTGITEPIHRETSSGSETFKTVEKKKKKHLKKLDVAPAPTVATPLPENKILITTDIEPQKEETPQIQKDDIFSDIARAGDVEICSLKTDDMEGSTDSTPDFIHHPLAASQQLIDDNNNMFIREITTTDEKLGLPILIPTEPIIQGSGETPEPDKIITSPPITQRERSKTNEPEKTDLKSKMMEVSQDMEELRLSIERSLAELTSMEKSEKDVEKRFEDKDAPTLGIVTEPLICPRKDDKVIETDMQANENVIRESENIAVVQDTANQTKVLTENIENKTEESKSIVDIHEKIEIEAAETIVSSEPMQKEEAVENTKAAPPVAPARKDHKGKGKGKRKGKQEAQSQQTTTISEPTSSTSAQTTSQETKKEEKTEQRSQQQTKSNENKGKQQAMQLENGCNGSEDISHDAPSNNVDLSFEPIENFEDALTSSVDDADVNKTFEMIASEVNNTPELTFQNPEINIIAPTEDAEADKPKQNPVSPPKNLLGHPDIPVPSNRTDYKKEKNKPPNMRQAKVKIKDAVDIEKDKTKQSKESQTDNKRKMSDTKNVLESFSYMTNENAEYIYKYSFRKVFLQTLCHVCRKELAQRVPCQFCSLVFYCSQKHKDEDWPQHQALCFAVCTIVHLKEQKHIYAGAKNIIGHNYRLLRMQMIVSCEKVLKRKLVPWEQEAFLYPRICADVSCREWKQSKLTDCEGCGQISYCTDHPDHLPTSHQRWCRSYALYQKLVHYQQTKGRLEPKLPPRVMAEGYRIPEKINEVLASMYDEKIDMTDTEYAALTQLATAPLTAAYSHQLAVNNANGISKKSSFVIHIVGAELQFEADVLHKWEVFFLHLKPDVKDLRVVLISPELNPSNLPLELLGKVNLCETCKTNKRRILFSFQDKKSYYEYWSSDEFHHPDIVCAFNQSIKRSSMYNGKDTWPTTISCILKLKTPFVITSYSINELQRDVLRVIECSELSGVSFKTISEVKSNPFASVRPDRNFITDDEIPLLFKNYCFSVLCGI